MKLLSNFVSATESKIRAAVEEKSESKLGGYPVADIMYSNTYRTIYDLDKKAARSKSSVWRTSKHKPNREAFIQLMQHIEQEGDDGTLIMKEIVAGQEEGDDKLPWARGEYRFFITNLTTAEEEKVQIVKTFGKDPDFIATFGRDTMIWPFQGWLRNERGWEGDWVSNFERRYQLHLRASLLVARRQFMRLSIGDLEIDGYMLNLSMQRGTATDDMAVPFSMQMLVRTYRRLDIDIGSYTGATVSKIQDMDPDYAAKWEAFVEPAQGEKVVEQLAALAEKAEAAKTATPTIDSTIEFSNISNGEFGIPGIAGNV